MDLLCAKPNDLSFMKTGDEVETNSGNMSCVPTAVNQGRASSRSSFREPGKGDGKDIGVKVTLHRSDL